ncbi:hypothetical protein LCGC14_0463670 [marine sediment metagenome]|uniref:Uncharacterized protein n=1 Tax=marine sediment metagenome TaxID=412755 RepID=A0A0F9SJH3_9ZZZZ
MSVYYPGCTTSQADPVCTDCPTKELGDVRGVFIVKNTFSFTDITDTSEWTAGLNAKDIFVFPFTRGSFESNENVQPGFGDTLETLDGYEHVLNFFEPNYKANCNFWNDIKRSKEWKVGYRTETQVHLSDNVAMFIPKAPIAEDKKQSVIWNVQAKFTQEDIPCPSDQPTGVFDRCIGIN